MFKEALIIFVVLLILLMLISLFGGSIRYGTPASPALYGLHTPSPERFSEHPSAEGLVRKALKKAADEAMRLQADAPATTDRFTEDAAAADAVPADAEAAAGDKEDTTESGQVEPFQDGDSFAAF